MLTFCVQSDYARCISRLKTWHDVLEAYAQVNDGHDTYNEHPQLYWKRDALMHMGAEKKVESPLALKMLYHELVRTAVLPPPHTHTHTNTLSILLQYQDLIISTFLTDVFLEHFLVAHCFQRVLILRLGFTLSLCRKQSSLQQWR